MEIGPYATTHHKAKSQSRSGKMLNKSLNKSNVLSEITEMPEIKMQYKATKQASKKFEKLIMDKIDKMDYKTNSFSSDSSDGEDSSIIGSSE